MSKEFFNAYGVSVVQTAIKERLPYKEEFEVSGGTTTVYKAYENSATAVIYKETIVEAAVTTITREIAYGAWADRATLTYAPVNDPVEVA